MLTQHRDKIIFSCCFAAGIATGVYGPDSAGWFGLLTAGLVYMSVFFHEIGHTVFYWLYGYAAVPTFDFASGGGMTYQLTGRSWMLQLGVFGAIGYFIWQSWRNNMALLCVPIGAALSLLVLTSFGDFHLAIILFMGHGVEATLAAFFLARGYFNLWLSRAGERWLNVFVGAFMLAYAITFVFDLMYDAGFAADYTAQKGGHRFGDFHRIEDEVGIPAKPLGWLFITYALACVAVLFGWIIRRLREEREAAV